MKKNSNNRSKNNGRFDYQTVNVFIILIGLTLLAVVLFKVLLFNPNLLSDSAIK